MHWGPNFPTDLTGRTLDPAIEAIAAPKSLPTFNIEEEEEWEAKSVGNNGTQANALLLGFWDNLKGRRGQFGKIFF